MWTWLLAKSTRVLDLARDQVHDPRRVVLQPARVDMHPSPGYAAPARGFPDLGAHACKPVRMGPQPGVQASPYHPGLGRPSARCLKPGVAARHGLQTQPHGSPTPRGVYRTQLYYAPLNKFAILHCGICRPRGVGLQPGAGVCNLTMPHQTVQSTMKSLIVYSNSLYGTKYYNPQ
uniref:Uncharacterized protein n=1 Tax=Populus trichocarpa TaxID=3694 RepID=A0A2K1Y337_POPTR